MQDIFELLARVAVQALSADIKVWKLNRFWANETKKFSVACFCEMLTKIQETAKIATDNIPTDIVSSMSEKPPLFSNVFLIVWLIIYSTTAPPGWSAIPIIRGRTNCDGWTTNAAERLNSYGPTDWKLIAIVLPIDCHWPSGTACLIIINATNLISWSNDAITSPHLLPTQIKSQRTIRRTTCGPIATSSSAVCKTRIGVCWIINDDTAAIIEFE